MSYITSQQVAEFRNQLKKEFPDYKFSVTRESYSTINVSIMQAPVRFTERDYEQLNHYHLESYQNSDILKRIKEICNQGNYDNSDVQTDYVEVGWYFRLNIGKWDKPFELKEVKTSTSKRIKKAQVIKEPVRTSFISKLLNFSRAFF